MTAVQRWRPQARGQFPAGFRSATPRADDDPGNAILAHPEAAFAVLFPFSVPGEASQHREQLLGERRTFDPFTHPLGAKAEPQFRCMLPERLVVRRFLAEHVNEGLFGFDRLGEALLAASGDARVPVGGDVDVVADDPWLTSSVSSSCASTTLICVSACSSSSKIPSSLSARISRVVVTTSVSSSRRTRLRRSRMRRSARSVAFTSGGWTRPRAESFN